jgi:hypothetical protein
MIPSSRWRHHHHLGRGAGTPTPGRTAASRSCPRTLACVPRSQRSQLTAPSPRRCFRCQRQPLHPTPPHPTSPHHARDDVSIAPHRIMMTSAPHLTASCHCDDVVSSHRISSACSSACSSHLHAHLTSMPISPPCPSQPARWDFATDLLNASQPSLSPHWTSPRTNHTYATALRISFGERAAKEVRRRRRRRAAS